MSEYLRLLAGRPLWQSFVSLYEVQSFNTATVPVQCQEIIPSLLADPIALLIKYTLLAPLRMDIGRNIRFFFLPGIFNVYLLIFFVSVYFTCIVKVMYNLLYFQVIVKLCSSLTEAECDQIISRYATNDLVNYSGFNCLGSVMAFILKITNNCKQFRTSLSCSPTTNNVSESIPSTSTSSQHQQQQLDLNLIERQLQNLCLPYLRIATLLRHHLYEQNLPTIENPQMEFACLASFLELVSINIDWNSFDAAEALCFIPGHERRLPELWCNQLMSLHRGSQAEHQSRAIAKLVNNQHTLWQQPKLLTLPREYEKLFTVR